MGTLVTSWQLPPLVQPRMGSTVTVAKSNLGPAAVQRLIGTFVTVAPSEVAPVLCSFFTLFSVLGSYFLLLPLREDAGISLGTSTLPLLFVSSLVVTVLFTPAASAFLARSTASDRETALKRLYSFLAFTLLIFYLLYNSSAVQHLLLGGASASSEQPVHSTDPNRPKWARQSLSSPLPEYQHYPQQWHSATAAEEAAAAFSPVDVKLSGRRLHHATDDPVSSSMGSSPVMQQSGDSSSYQGSAGFTAEAGVRNIGRVASSRDGDPMLTTPQRALRAGFYIWVNVINLIGISSLWARSADAFTPEAAARLFGFISAGATLGQLAGSLIALAVTKASETAASASGAKSRNSGLFAASHLILLAAVLQLVAAQLSSRVRAPVSSAGASDRSQQLVRLPLADYTAVSPTRSSLASARRASGSFKSLSLNNLNGLSVAGASQAMSGTTSSRIAGSVSSSRSNSSSSSNGTRRSEGFRVSGVFSGFQLVWSSEYLLTLCGHLLLTYVVGSLMYFQRALVVSASVAGSSYRAAFFATLNSWSAAGILVLQLCATSSLLSYLGMYTALQLTPIISLIGALAVTLWPSPAMVAGFEVLRKLIGYAVNRPAREVLFTVVSRDEKYRAKLVIDTVVQRLGDAVAAAAFQVLDVHLRLGQAGVGVAGCGACLAWLLVARILGRQHVQLAQHGHATALQQKEVHQV